MPFGARDILLTIRAKDQASRVIRDIGLAFDGLSGEAEAAAKQTIAGGAALVGVGVGLAAVGIVGLGAMKRMVDMAVAYRQSAALTLTQTDKLGASVQDIENIGLNVAKSVAAPLDQLQPALYDIFSSMDVNLKGAQILLTGFAKAGVAGQVSVQTAGRATIAVMNAWKIPAADVTKVLDTQFELVRKGVGTYDEFASSLGRSIPSARRAGQSFENLAGMLAFLTRNGLSTTQASTSAARALDNLANSKVQTQMKAFGVSVLDASGRIRNMNDVATDLGKKLDGLTDAQKAAALDKIFKGAGNNIQARRFWDLAIRNFQDLNTLTGDMVNSSGALQNAYDIMFNQPATQAQQLANSWDALKISMGQALIPMEVQALKWGQKILDWFNGMNDSTKALIAKILVFASAGAVLVGILSAVAGAIKLIVGAFKLAGGIGSVVSSLMDPLVLVLLALAALAYVIYRNWDTLVKWWNKYFPTIKDDFMNVWNPIVNWWNTNWPKIKDTVIRAWKAIVDYWNNTVWPLLVNTWTWLKTNIPIYAAEIRDAVVNAWNTIRDDTITAWNTVMGWIQTAWDLMQQFGNWFWTNFGPGIMRVWNTLATDVPQIIQSIIDITERLWSVLQAVGSWFATTFAPFFSSGWDLVYNIFVTAKDNILMVVSLLTSLFIQYWEAAFPIVIGFIRGAWDTITGIFQGALDIITGIFNIFAGIFTGDWGRLWDGVKQVVKGAWTIIESVIQGGWDTISTAFDLGVAGIQVVWRNLWDIIDTIYKVIWNNVQLAIQTGWQAIKDVWDVTSGIIESVWRDFWNAISSIYHSIADPIISAVQHMIDIIQSAIDKLKSLANVSIPGAFLGPLGKLIGHASGGGVQTLAPMIVGEQGQELFVPAARGTLFTAPETQALLAGAGAAAAGKSSQTTVSFNAPMTFYGTQNAQEVANVVDGKLSEFARELRRVLG